MSSGPCHHCGCSEIDTDPARGDAVCTSCGSVLEDNIIVSEVQFAENSHGGSRAIGQLVSAEGQSSGGLNIGYQHGMGKESRMITLRNAKRKIMQLAEQLRLNQHCIDTAYNFYKMALAKRMTRGRKNSHVVAACVYMVCRIEGTAHMLLDVSDILQVNVYELGKTYLRLSTALCINIPAIDPCLFIVRFAHRLEFGDKTHEVAMTALRLVQRMKRDWMHTGRRPSGLCGAALLVAGRLHEFNRTVKDVIKVVKVCQATVRKRLTEFGDTPSSRLTLEEFMTIDLEAEQDPPSFKAARRKKLHQLEDQKVEEDISQVQKLIEKALEDKKKKLRGPYSKYAAEISQDDVDDNQEETITEKFIVEETIGTIQEVMRGGSCSETDGNTAEQTDLSNIVLPPAEVLQPGRNHINGANISPVKGPGPTAASLGLKESIEECMRVTESINDNETGGDLDLTGLDDAELDSYIMTESEAKMKTELWDKCHAEYIKEQKEKEERKAKEEEENANKPEQKKKRRHRKRSQIQANTAGEAIEKMLQQKKISCKIDYDVLKSLNSTTNTENSEEKTVEPVAVEKPTLTRVSKSRVKPTVKGGAPPSSISGVMSTILQGTRWRQSATPAEDNQEPPAKVICLTEDEKDNDVIVLSEENGPSARHEPEAEPEEEEMEEEYEEEDDIHMSAAQLLGQHRGEQEVDYYGEDQEEYFD